MSETGITRSSIRPDHALITPESHVPLKLPAWQDADTIALITPELGAGFSQYLVNVTEAATLGRPNAEEEYCIVVLQGSAVVKTSDAELALNTSDYCHLPQACDWTCDVAPDSQLLIFAKVYQPLAGVTQPAPFSKHLTDVKAEPFLGDPDAMLQVLLPDDLAYDWGINLFEFSPGATLPQVESHWMEHGLYMLQGGGVYRLGDHWYIVKAEDAIWMSPYLLQWFAATGKTTSKYIYYKEMNRAPGS